MMILFFRYFLLLSLSAYGVFAALSVIAAYRWKRDGYPIDPDFAPPVTIFKPVCGIDAGAYDNFVGFCKQDYPAGCLQILFGALDANDPVLPLIHQLQSEFPLVDIQCIVGNAQRLPGHNRKVCNLLNLIPHAKYDLFVLCDSDMRVSPDYLRRIVAPFGRPPKKANRPVGAVTCPYRSIDAQSFPAALEAMGIGIDFIPSVLVSRMIEEVSFALGSTIVIPRSVLSEIGGFHAFVDDLADDYRIGNSVSKLGKSIEISDYVIEAVLGKEKMSTMWSRRLRWARTLRSCRPAGYLGSFVMHGMVLAFLNLLAWKFGPVGVAAMAITLSVRAITALWVANITEDGNVWHFFPILFLSDLFNAILFVTSFCGNRISWRGTEFTLLRDGKLEAVVSEIPVSERM